MRIYGYCKKWNCMYFDEWTPQADRNLFSILQIPSHCKHNYSIAILAKLKDYYIWNSETKGIPLNCYNINMTSIESCLFLALSSIRNRKRFFLTIFSLLIWCSIIVIVFFHFIIIFLYIMLFIILGLLVMLCVCCTHIRLCNKKE